MAEIWQKPQPLPMTEGEFGPVAYSNDYNDLDNKPDRLSQFADDLDHVKGVKVGGIELVKDADKKVNVETLSNQEIDDILNEEIHIDGRIVNLTWITTEDIDNICV